MNKISLFSILSFLFLVSISYAQDNTTSLYAAPLLGIFVTSMIVVIVWLMYKDKFEQPKVVK